MFHATRNSAIRELEVCEAAWRVCDSWGYRLRRKSATAKKKKICFFILYMHGASLSAAGRLDSLVARWFGGVVAKWLGRSGVLVSRSLFSVSELSGRLIF